MTRLVLLDRDGVINVDSDEYVKSIDEFHPIAESLAAIARLHKAGFLIGVCTNQSAVGRGYLTEAALEEIHHRLHDLVNQAGGAIDAIAYCPHLPDEDCACRKPRPGMLEQLMRELCADPEQTVFVGDSVRDLNAALAAGCEPVLVRTGNGRDSESTAGTLGVTRIYDSLASFATHEIGRLPANSKVQH